MIGFHSKNEEIRFRDDLDLVRSRIDELGEQKVSIVCQPLITQSVIDELGNYIHLSF